MTIPATILIFEDHAPVRKLLTRGLEDAVYQFCAAANGQQRLKRFRAQPLVITDLEMPDMNCLEVILALTRAFLDVKVIAMSGGSADELQKTKLLVARQTFSKPLNLEALLHAIQYELAH